MHEAFVSSVPLPLPMVSAGDDKRTQYLVSSYVKDKSQCPPTDPAWDALIEDLIVLGRQDVAASPTAVDAGGTI